MQAAEQITEHLIAVITEITQACFKSMPYDIQNMNILYDIIYIYISQFVIKTIWDGISKIEKI